MNFYGIEINPIISYGVQAGIIAILVNTILGWMFAISKGEFDIRVAPRFLATSVFPYIGALLIMAVVAIVDEMYLPVFAIVSAAVTAKFGIEVIKDKIIEGLK